MIIRATEKSVRANSQQEVPLDETRVEFDEDKIDRIVNDVRDEAHLLVAHVKVNKNRELVKL